MTQTFFPPQKCCAFHLKKVLLQIQNLFYTIWSKFVLYLFRFPRLIFYFLLIMLYIFNIMGNSHIAGLLFLKSKLMTGSASALSFGIQAMLIVMCLRWTYHWQSSYVSVF